MPGEADSIKDVQGLHPSLCHQHRLFVSIGFCVLLLLLGSCQPVEREVPGTYQAQTDWGRPTLLLKHDHTFEQSVRENEGNTKTMSGKWSLEKGVLTLAPCLAVNHQERDVYVPACGTSMTRLGLSSVEIALDPDAGIAYRK